MHKKQDGNFLSYILSALLVVIIVLAFVIEANSEPMHKGHEHFHDDFYSKWKTAEGYSCCNSKTRYGGDCAPHPFNAVRSSEAGYEVFIEGAWVSVEKEKVRPYFAPDFSHHLCHIGKRVLCLVIGGGV